MSDETPIEPEVENIEQVSSEDVVEPSPTDTDKDDAVQKRINKITAQKYEAERRADEAEKKLAESSREKPTELKAPSLEDFDYDESDYQEALIDYKVSKKMEAHQATIDKRTSETSAKAKAKDNADKFASAEGEFASKVDGYSEAVSKLPRLHPESLDAIYSMDNGPQVAYFLGTHLDQAYEIANMTPVYAAVKLGQIAAQLAIPKKNASTTNAPAPVDTIGGGGSISNEPNDGAKYE